MGEEAASAEGGQKAAWVPLALVTGVLLAVFPAFGWFGWHFHGLPGVWAASLAGGVCWLGSAGALLLATLFSRPDQALASLLSGMFLRMGLPLGVITFLVVREHPWLEANVVAMTVVFYLIALVVETLLSLRLVANPRPVSRVS